MSGTPKTNLSIRISSWLLASRNPTFQALGRWMGAQMIARWSRGRTDTQVGYILSTTAHKALSQIEGGHRWAGSANEHGVGLDPNNSNTTDIAFACNRARPVHQVSLMVLSALLNQFAERMHPNMLRDVRCAIQGNRDLLEASGG